MKIAIIKKNIIIFQGPYNKKFLTSLYQLLYPIFKDCDVAVIEDNEIKVVLTYEELLNSEV